MTLAREVMTSHPSTCEDLDSVYEAVLIMRQEDCGGVPVVNRRGQLVGLVTERHICQRLVLDRQDPEMTEVREIMDTDVPTCHPDDDMETVIYIMERAQSRNILVVDDQNRCIGIITEGDIAGSDVASRLPEVVHTAQYGPWAGR